ncbi:PREDICTED: F-box protein SKIP17-like isoform X5 [Brassica oleracea var. oleracea]|uniref:F-box protein SKIP17-like isoform X5 n=1 Tax=Brassica oleracea var. oleracea TaxID=109376 RepID=UPI0006A72DE2|nr:PREDICTED: F-box protein SKIP17-like isoform X5 [Brassica oleracea var. oleracea]
MSLSCCWNRSKQKSGENKTLSTFGLMDPPTSPAAQNPSSLHSDSIISSLLSFHASTPFSIACSFDRELEKALASASDDASVQDRLLNRTIQLASLLLDSTERCFRKRASAHNSVAWVLPPELTVKVFSKLDTKSLMQAAACCTLFNKCAMDRSSYAHIDLTTADNEVVCTMIHRAGKELRSRLTSLRLYNVGPMHYNSLSSVLSVCSNLTDLRIVGSGSNSPYMNLFMTLSKKCRLIEHLCLVSHHPLGNIDASTASHLIELVTKSPNLTSLTLLCFQLTNEIVRSLVESCRKLKYLNLSRSPKIDGCFLRDLGNSCKESPLETLIMRNCVKLEEKEVLELCNTLLKGNFKFIRHIDVSSNNGLVSDDGRRSYKPKFPVEKLKEERPDVTLVADFPLERSGKRYHVGVEGDDEELREIEMMDAKNDEEENDDDDSFEGDDDDV